MHRVDCTSAKIKLSFRFARGRQNFKNMAKQEEEPVRGTWRNKARQYRIFFFSIITKYSIVSSIFICLLIVNMNLYEGGGGGTIAQGRIVNNSEWSCVKRPLMLHEVDSWGTPVSNPHFLIFPFLCFPPVQLRAGTIMRGKAISF